jgi:hypothetical protein
MGNKTKNPTKKVREEAGAHRETNNNNSNNSGAHTDIPTTRKGKKKE